MCAGTPTLHIWWKMVPSFMLLSELSQEIELTEDFLFSRWLCCEKSCWGEVEGWVLSVWVGQMLADQSLPTAWAPWILRLRFWHNFPSTVLWVYLTTEIADLIWYKIYVTDENLYDTDWGKLWEELRFEHLGIQDKVESWKITSWLCIWEKIKLISGAWPAFSSL